MVRALSLSFVMLAAPYTPVASYHAWHWQRTIIPNHSAPAAEQCAVLDAELFAGSAPGLRDVRLLQDGRELAYAVDESHDRSFDGKVSGQDRAVFDPVAVIPARSAPGNIEIADARLRAHVPVERLRLITATPLAADVSLRLTAMPRKGSLSALEDGQPEAVPLTARGGDGTSAVTLGANLQNDADVEVSTSAGEGVQAVALEMRRREICYQPLSGAPVTVLYGNPSAQPVHYEYGRYYQPKAAPLMAVIGPARVNDAYRSPAKESRRLSPRTKALLAIAACLSALVLTLDLLQKPEASGTSRQRRHS